MIGPVVKVDQPVKEVILNDKSTTRPISMPRLRLKRSAMAELSKKYDVHPTQIGTWNRASIENMWMAFWGQA